ncbi:MAG: c-type cytochrome, partial [Nitrospinota bacterium]
MKAKVSTTGSFEITEKMKRAVAAALPPEVKQGETLFWGKAQCSRCHQIGEKGDQTRGPNLEDIGLRAKSRAKDRGLDSATQYLIESVLRPGAYVVAGYVDDMEKTYRPPLNLTKKELVRIIAYLQSQGGKVDLWAIDFPDPARPQPEAALFPLQGDKEEGREFFFEEADCGSCHRVGDKGGGIGPELTHIGAYRDRAFFLREILDPNAVVAPGFRPIDLVLKPKADGTQESYSGVLVRETPEAYVVKLSDESIRTFSKSGVEKASKQSESPMPDFTEILTVRQLADLIAFLQSLK